MKFPPGKFICSIRHAPLLLLCCMQPALPAFADGAERRPNIPETIEADGKLRLDYTDEQLVLPRGLQPSMLCTKSGVFVVQAQIPEKPIPSSRMVYPWAMETRVSRDGAKTWTPIPNRPGENGLNLEGGAIQ